MEYCKCSYPTCDNVSMHNGTCGECGLPVPGYGEPPQPKKKKEWDESVKCKDCGAHGGFKPGSMDVFYLHDALWNSFADTHDILCFDCAQKRLGRPITLSDLKECAITRCMRLGIRIANQSKETTDGKGS